MLHHYEGIMHLHVTPTEYVHMVPDSSFNLAIPYILAHEGGLSNDKNDPGGITNYGISLRYLKSEKMDLNRDGKYDAKDIRELTPKEAKKIYLDKWWNKYKYYNIKNQQVATKIFDMSVNMGPDRAHKLVKKAINAIVIEDIPVDGRLDSSTINTINTLPSVHLMMVLRELQKEFYINLTVSHPRLLVFLKGWVKRSEF
jgi:lysozyme family protein